MASGFPASIDNFTDPLSNSPLNSPSHSALHSDVNDAVEKIETYMGLVKVIPTGATNGTVGATGTVTVGTAVSSVTVSGCFSSTYDNYKIVYEGGVSSALNDFTIILGATVSGYYSNMMYSYFNATTPTVLNTSNASSFVYVGGATTTNTHLEFDLFNPFVTKNTILTNATWLQATSAGGLGKTNGYLSNTTSYSGFTIGLATGTITGGTVRVYGYRN
jgi:predicted small secreted protein